MIWSLAVCVYITIGAPCASALVNRPEARATGFNPVTAFTSIIGTIVLWPMLLALAVAEGDQE